MSRLRFSLKYSQSVTRSMCTKTFKDNETFIISAARTPIGRFRGSLAQFTAPQLGSIAIKGAIERCGFQKDLIDEALIGHVRQAMVGQNPARQAILMAGLPYSIPCTTINKACASGMKSYQFIAQAIQCRQIDCGIAGGQESLSRVPYYLPRGEIPYGGMQIIDGMVFDFTDRKYNLLMGALTERTAQKQKISREEQDDYAMLSYRRSAEHAKKVTELEIVPVDIPATKKTPATQITEDEEYKRVNFDKFRSLPTVFQKENGTITAGNASTVNDGASAAILASGRLVKQYGLKPLARILAYGDAALDPEDFGIAPSYAIPKVLQQAGLKKEDISLWEINEAFSVVVLANIKLLKLDPEKVNVFGGAVSIGHPVGMSGSRIINLLALHLKPGQFGMAAICNAGGGASAVLVEKL